MAQPRNNEKAVNDIMAVQLRKVPQVFVSECVLYVCMCTMCTMCACVQCCVYVRVHLVVGGGGVFV